MPWWQERLLAFDVESTGTSVEDDRIVSAALVLCGGGQPTEAYEWLVDPGVPIHPEATAVHGITDEHVREHGTPAEDAIPEIIDTLEGALSWGAPLVIKNAPFDMTMSDREARRHGVAPLTDRLRFPVVDPQVIDGWLDKYRPGSRKLDAICEHYGYPLDNAHDAGADALAAARAAWCVAVQGRVIRKAWNPEMEDQREALVRDWEWCREDLWRLHDMQRRWYHQRAASLVDHFHETRQFDAAMSISLDWPLKPFACNSVT